MRPSRFTFSLPAAIIATSAAAQVVNWPLHNLDLAGSRLLAAGPDQPVQREVADAALAVPARRHRRRQQPDDAGHRRRHDVRDRFARQRVRASTPPTAICCGRYDVTNLIGGGAREGYVFRNRGVVLRRRRRLHGRRARSCSRSTRRPASRFPTFGKNGQASVILDVLKQRYPDVKTAISLGYWFTTAPQFYNGVHLHRQHAQREPHSRRPRAGRRREDRQGALALQHHSAGREGSGLGHRGPDVGGRRAQRRRHLGNAVDRSGARAALRGRRQSVRRQHEAQRARISSPIRSSRSRSTPGTLKWYFQQTHHDVWDYDSGNPPILFDMQVRGQRVKALAEASKNGYLYILNRETGKPVHPIKEMPVPTDDRASGRAAVADAADSVHGERASRWRRCVPVFPIDIPAERLATRQARAACSRRRGPNQIYRARHRGRRQLRPAVLQPADRPALRERRSTAR